MKKIFSKIYYYQICINGLLILLFISSCIDNTRNIVPSVQSKTSKHAIIKKPGSSFNDTIFINEKAAVFYSPDSLQMEKIKEVNEKNIFDMITHDCHYQMQNARLSLKKYQPDVKVIDASKARYLVFIKENTTKICIDLNDKNDICGLFLFDGKKDPILADMPNIDTILDFYFRK